MKKVKNIAVLLVSATILQCCSAEDPIEEYYNSADGNVTNGTIFSSQTKVSGSSELTTFTVEIDKTTAEPEQTVAAYYPDEEDNLANNTFETEVSIDLSNPVAKTENGVTITVNGGHVTADHGSSKGICYVVCGETSNGSLTIVGDKKYELLLEGVNITNPDSAAVSLLSSKRAFIVINGNNTLSDGTTSWNDHKGAFYCKGKMLVSGSGSLSVSGNYNNGIHTADYIVIDRGTNIYVKSTTNHGIKANDGVYINGGILNVEVSGTAAKGINCESNIQVNGGRTTVVTTGGGEWDSDDQEANAAAAIKCDSTYTQNGGEVLLKSTGNGGKGLRAGWEAYINGGTLSILTSGGTYSSNNDTSSPKGIKVGTKNEHGVLEIHGGTLMVRTSGKGGEGIESKGTQTVADGTVQVSAYDDGINSAGDMTITGGSIVSVGMNSDGLDANGNMYISGGNIVAYGAGGAESGIDTGEQYRLYVTGGSIFGIGGRIDATIGSTTQGIVSTTASVQGNTTITVQSGSTTMATFVMPPYSTSGTVMVSAEGMTNGNTYTIDWGTTSNSVTASESVGQSMGGGQPMGGGPRW